MDTRCSFLTGKQLEHEGHHSCSSSAEVENSWGFTSFGLSLEHKDMSKYVEFVTYPMELNHFWEAYSPLASQKNSPHFVELEGS
jgi:hypothetical protein